MELKDKTVVIVGATGGIGSVLTQLLDKEGANLLLVSKSEDKLKNLIKKLNGKHQYFVCDLTDNRQIVKTIENIKQSVDNISVLVNTAGIGVYKDIESVGDTDWNDSYKINVSAPFLLIRDLLPLLQKDASSLVLNIGSGAGTIPMKGRSVYCSTKFALRGFTLSLAEEFKDKNPFFCLITLGSTITNFGNMTVAEKEKEHAKGKAYFFVEWVANKLTEIIRNDTRETEITLFPGDYGFGTWKKP